VTASTIIGRQLLLRRATTQLSNYDEFVLDPVRCYTDTPNLDLIGRMHGRGWYARTSDRFEMPRIDVTDWPVRAKAAE
jgi:hypothetical protein